MLGCVPVALYYDEPVMRPLLVSIASMVGVGSLFTYLCNGTERNISRKDGAPNLHIHVTASDDSFNAFGGHLDRGIVQNMLEVYVYPYPETIERKPYQYWFFMDI